MTHHPHRLIAALAAVAAGAMPLAVPAADEPTSASGLVLQDCRITDQLGLRSHAARCGTLTRPENPDDPGGRQVQLFVAVVPALTSSPAPDAFTAIAGGPGAASTQFYASFAPAFAAVRRQRDILLVDQRGTGRSNALDCDDMEADIADPSPEEMRRLTRACLDSLENDPRYFTTSVAVQDLDAVRAALGYDQLDVYGASYGTRVALHYLRRYPERSRTVVLDGVVPAQIPVAAEIATDAQDALEKVFERCEGDADCRARFPALRTHFTELQERLREAPVDIALADPYTGEPREETVTEAHLQIALRMLSYDPYSVSMIPLLLEQAFRGNYTPLAAQAVMVADTLTGMLSYGMHNSVVCTEDKPFYDDFLAGTDLPERLAASYLGDGQIESIEHICEVWPAGLMDEDFKTPVVSDLPVLVLSGSDDPVTPPRNGERTIGADGEYLSNALHVVVPGQGHGVAATGCLPQLLGDFVDQADVAGLDTSCIERLGPAGFFLDFSAPAP